MELQGKIIAALEPRSGVSARGEWKMQEFVVETHESYPHKMMFSVFGADRLQRFNIQVGQEVLVSFDINAREYQGRWYNDIRAFDVRLVDPATIGAQGMQAPPPPMGPAPAQGVAPQPQTANPTPFPPTEEEGSADDLPF